MGGPTDRIGEEREIEVGTKVGVGTLKNFRATRLRQRFRGFSQGRKLQKAVCERETDKN